MLIRPASRALALASVFCLSLSGAAHAAGNDAQTVLQKMGALYRGAKSYEGALSAHQTVTGPDGKATTITTSQKVRYKGPNKFIVQATISATGPMAARIPSDTTTQISDGSNLWIYSASKKQYIKRPLPPTAKSFTALQLLRIPDADKSSVKMLAPASVGGRTVYVIQMLAAPPAVLNPQQKAQFLSTRQPQHLFIDRQNYHLLKMTQGAKTTAEVTFNTQTINSPVADSAFNFTPPAGSKEFVPPAAPQGGIAPGAPGH